MIGIDTNVLVRFLVADDPEQSEAARALVLRATPDAPLFVGTLVLAEVYWVLTRAMRYSPETVIRMLAELIDVPEFVFEHDRDARTLLSLMSAVDLADGLIAAAAIRAGCRRTVTFDRAAARALPDMELLS